MHKLFEKLKAHSASEDPQQRGVDPGWITPQVAHRYRKQRGVNLGKTTVIDPHIHHCLLRQAPSSPRILVCSRTLDYRPTVQRRPRRAASSERPRRRQGFESERSSRKTLGYMDSRRGLAVHEPARYQFRSNSCESSSSMRWTFADDFRRLATIISAAPTPESLKPQIFSLSLKCTEGHGLVSPTLFRVRLLMI